MSIQKFSTPPWKTRSPVENPGGTAVEISVENQSPAKTPTILHGTQREQKRDERGTNRKQKGDKRGTKGGQKGEFEGKNRGRQNENRVI